MEVYYSKDKKPTNVNYIIEIVENIARSQRSVCSTCGECVSCDSCFCTNLFNTIPVRLAYCGGEAVGGLVGVGGATTTYFRVECVTNQRYVKLRLLTATAVGEEVVIAGTNYTMVVDLDCICAIQCFEPTNITACATAVI